MNNAQVLLDSVLRAESSRNRSIGDHEDATTDVYSDPRTLEYRSAVEHMKDVATTFIADTSGDEHALVDKLVEYLGLFDLTLTRDNVRAIIAENGDQLRDYRLVMDTSRQQRVEHTGAAERHVNSRSPPTALDDGTRQNHGPMPIDHVSGAMSSPRTATSVVGRDVVARVSPSSSSTSGASSSATRQRVAVDDLPLEHYEVKMSRLHDLIESHLLYRMPFDPRICGENPVIVKLISYVHLTIAETLIKDPSARWIRIVVNALVAPIATWEKVADVFGKQSGERYSARLERMTPDNFSTGYDDDENSQLRALQIVWSTRQTNARASVAQDAVHRVPMDIDACRLDPVFFKVFSYIQLSIAEQLNVNRSMRWTLLQVQRDVGPIGAWQRVVHLMNSEKSAFRVEFKTYRSKKGEVQAIRIEW